MRLNRLLAMFVVSLGLFAIALTGYAQPGIPQNVRATKMGPTSVRLDWDAVSIASSYLIYRDIHPISSTGGLIPITEVTAPTHTYTDAYSTGDYFYAMVSVFPSGTLSGTVTGPGGANVKTATGLNPLIWIPSLSLYTYTADNGSYSLANIPTGTYSVTIYAAEYAVSTLSTVTIASGTNTQNVTLTQPAYTVLSGTYGSNLHLTNNNRYQLNGLVTMLAGAAMTIDSGVTVVGNFPTLGYLAIAKQAMLNVNGCKLMPAVFTSNRPLYQRTGGEWGGITLLGRGHDARGVNIQAEGSVGSDPNMQGGSGADTTYDYESSCHIHYLRLEYPGYRFTATNELNGFAQYGIGRGSSIDHIEVTHAVDDGIEDFGGCPNYSYVMLLDGGDDGFDWTDGYNGTVHHMLIRQRDIYSDRGIEADNVDVNNYLRPISDVKIANLTICNAKGLTGYVPISGSNNEGMMLRRGTRFKIYNAIVTRSRTAGINMPDMATSKFACSDTLTDAGVGQLNGESVINNSIFWDNGPAQTDTIGGNVDVGIGYGHFCVTQAQIGTHRNHSEYPVCILDIAAPTGWHQGGNTNQFNEGGGLIEYAGAGIVGQNATNHIVDPMLPISMTQGNGNQNPVFDPRPTAGSPAYTMTPAPAATLAQYGLPYSNYIGAFSSPTDDWYIGWTNFIGSQATPPATYVCTGYVTHSDASPYANVTITPIRQDNGNPAADPVITDENGYYSFAVVYIAGLTVVVTPSAAGSTFTPSSSNWIMTTSNVVRNFQANN